MANVKITALPAASDVVDADLIPVVDDPSGTPVTKKATWSQVWTWIQTKFAAGIATFLATPTSANLAAAVTDETGSGLLVFSTSPALTTPNIGAASGTSAVLTSFVSTGATPAVTGQVRISNSDLGIIGKDTGGTDRNVVAINTSNLVDVGNTSIPTIVRGSNGTASTDGVSLSTTTSTYNFRSDRALFPNTGLPHLTDSDGTHTYQFAVSNLAGNRTITLPLLTGNDVFVFESHTQNLTNKTLVAPRVRDSGADHYYTIGVSNLAADRTVTLPLLTGNDDFVCAAHTQTLTNKTLNLSNNTLTATSAQLAAACTDDTGSGGALVFASSPSISSPTLSNTTTISSGRVILASGNISSLDVNWATAQHYYKNLSSGGNTLTFSNATDGETVIIALTSNAGGSTVTWPAAIKWPGGTEPTQSTPSKTDVYTITQINGVLYGVQQADFS